MTPEEKSQVLELKRENRKLRKYLEKITRVTFRALAAIDFEMRKPSDVERGRRISAICNELELINDMARHIGLGVSFKSKKWKNP